MKTTHVNYLEIVFMIRLKLDQTHTSGILIITNHYQRKGKQICYHNCLLIFALGTNIVPLEFQHFGSRGSHNSPTYPQKAADILISREHGPMQLWAHWKSWNIYYNNFEIYS